MDRNRAIRICVSHLRGKARELEVTRLSYHPDEITKILTLKYLLRSGKQ